MTIDDLYMAVYERLAQEIERLSGREPKDDFDTGSLWSLGSALTILIDEYERLTGREAPDGGE